MEKLEKEINRLKQLLQENVSIVKERLQKVQSALKLLSKQLAEELILSDSIINENEVKIEKKCVETITLYQPITQNLRTIISIMRINGELERISDIITNISLAVSRISKKKEIIPPFSDFEIIFEKILHNFDLTLTNFFHLNIEGCKESLVKDKEIDLSYREELGKLIIKLEQEKLVKSTLRLINIIKSIERIGDHIKNIAEDTIYVLSGEIIRHQKI